MVNFLYLSCHRQRRSERLLCPAWTKADFTLRWCAASSVITPTEYRVVMDGQIYDILSVDHMNFKHKSVKLHCRKARR